MNSPFCLADSLVSKKFPHAFGKIHNYLKCGNILIDVYCVCLRSKRESACKLRNQEPA